MAWTLMTIDPSTRNLGWALFCLADMKGTYKDSGHVLLKDGDDTTEPEEPDEKAWIIRSDAMCEAVLTIAHKHQPRLVLIELPKVMAGHEAAMRSDAITKLGFCTGQIRGSLRQYGFQVQCIPVGVWKGNTPKQITQDRILRHWGLQPADHNEADAIGIADFHIRRVLRYSPAFRAIQGKNALWQK